MEQIILMRHGDWDYHHDTLLPAGKERVGQKAGELADIITSDSLIYSSPARRAKQTASILAEKLNCGPIEIRKEIRYVYQNHMREIGRLHKELNISVLDSWRRFNGVETPEEVVIRMNKLLYEVWKSEPDLAICVTHSENITAYLSTHKWIDFAEFFVLRSARYQFL